MLVIANAILLEYDTSHVTWYKFGLDNVEDSPLDFAKIVDG